MKKKRMNKQPGPVCQSDLAAYFALNAKAKKIERHREALRKKIAGALERGASIERGHYTADYQPTERTTVSWDKLIEILGADRAKKIKARIEPTTSFRLIVKERKKPPKVCACLFGLPCVDHPDRPPPS
jgi:hypothetical protein